jgi:Flp pilus assembly protein TadB
VNFSIPVSARRNQLRELLAGHAATLPIRKRAVRPARSSGEFSVVEGFERDYPAFLVALAASIRTGLDPLSAMLGLKDLFPTTTILGAQLARTAALIESGATEERAIAGFGEEVSHPDLPLFRSAFLLARREGSSLGDCLERLASVTRARQSFRRKTRAAVAMQRLSAFGIGGCAVLIGVMQAVANLDALVAAVNHPVGFRLLCIGFGLVVFGLGWMLRLTRSKV